MRKSISVCAVSLAAIVLAGCSDSESGSASPTEVSLTPPVDATGSSISDEEAARFLNQATFGATDEDIDRLQDMGYAQWFLDQFARPQASLLESVLLVEASGAEAGRDELSETFWTQSITGQDQLRQRIGYALSQILVVSYSDGAVADRPVAMANYMDILSSGAFGNYRQTLENVTYSPAMAIWLTYLQNQKADEEGIVVPDENYAREIMQLFTIGTLELQPNGALRLDDSGQPIETYDNDDVTELAKVFTGLSWGERDRFFGRPDNIRSEYVPLEMYENQHSSEAKSFLGTTIPADTLGDQSIAAALDALANHPNTAPFISKQLIQRLVTSNPSDAYVGRVADAFRTGVFTFADGTSVGDGAYGDLRAVVAAILMDAEAMAVATGASGGKLREPVLRFTLWARAFGVSSTDVENIDEVQDSRGSDRLNQQAYRSPSVFNFYRPGFVSPGSQSADAGLVAPELQITTAASVTGYANFMEEFVFNEDRRTDFAPDYSDEVALAGDPAALVDRLDLLLTAGQLSEATRQRTIEAVSSIQDGDDGFSRDELRVRVAVLFVVTSSDFVLQI